MEGERESAATAATVNRLNIRVIGICLAAALGGFLFGFDTAVINGAVEAMSSHFQLSSGLKGFAVSSALLGCAAGAWFAGPLANRLGRVPVMLIAALMFLTSAIGSGLAFTVWDLIAWRVVGGLGVGAASVIVPAYIAEVSPARIRGRLASLQQLAIVTGIFAALMSDAWLADRAGGSSETLFFDVEAWRWMFIAEAIPAIIYGLAAFRLPESPRFLVSRDRLTDATRVLRDYTGIVDVRHKIDDIKATLAVDHRVRMGDLAGPRLGLKPVVWIGILLSVFQQFVGINVIFYYSSTLWQSVGFTEADAMKITVITSITNIAVTLVAIALVDRIGRRPLLLTGSAGMFLTLGWMSVAFSQAQLIDGEVILEGFWATSALIAANLFVVFFGVSWGPVVWVLLGEIFPNFIRAGALAVAAAAQWIANFAISTSFPTFSDFGLTFAYGFYAFFAALSFVFVLTQVPETKGRELEEMEDDPHHKFRTPRPSPAA